MTGHPQGAPLTDEQLAAIEREANEISARKMEAFDGQPPDDDNLIGADEYERVAVPVAVARAIVTELRYRRALAVSVPLKDAYAADAARGRDIYAELAVKLGEVYELRALLADLKAEGCPWHEREDGVQVCDYCGGPVTSHSADELPAYAHLPMPDGKPCLWVRIESA